MQASSLSSTPRPLTSSLDEVYIQLRASFLASGKGRPPMLPKVAVNNKLIFQINLIREESGSTYTHACKLLKKLLPDLLIGYVQLKDSVQRLTLQFAKSPCDSVTSSLFLLEPYDTDFVCQALADVGLNKRSLLAPAKDFNVPPAAFITNEVIVRIEAFKNVNSCSIQKSFFMTDWITKLTNIAQEPAKKHLKAVLKQYEQLRKRQSRNPDAYRNFLKAQFCLEPSVPDSTPASSSTESNPSQDQMSNAEAPARSLHTQPEPRVTLFSTCTQTESLVSKTCSSHTDEIKELKKYADLLKEVKQLRLDNECLKKKTLL
ncbi:hypothetical protein ElyMa_006091700 [Elysia marginata]|uniref:Uncharacterized protein n=1 Tax=Elysia marginata TaxID=1093978 RepID=A0AAV4GRE0_9GAST|nr:hypothetical protein ElyMa_006091700 [Elysia marginata]